MKVLVVAGGGGHFAPALSVLEKFPKDWEVLLVGRKYTFEGDKALSLEHETAKKLNIPFKDLTTGRLQRKFTRYTIKSLLKVPIGFFQAVGIVRSYKPDVVLSFGGYVSVPVTFAAFLFRTPIVIHEQTFGAGVANKFVAKYAQKICISWKESEKFFPKSKTILTGNPLRQEFIEYDYKESSGDKTRPLIYITGGSSGSHAFNVLIESCVERLLQKYDIVHQTGDAKKYDDFERLSKLRNGLSDEIKERYMPVKFVDPGKVADFLNQADLIVSRSGVNTITEILYFGKPCLLIPLPYGQQNEQLTNALFVKDMGLAEVVDQHKLNSDTFLSLLKSMMENIEKYKIHAPVAKRLIDPNASQKIVEVLSNVKKKKKFKKT